MANVYGEDGGTFAGGRRRPTNAGYGADPFNPAPTGMPGTGSNPNTGIGGAPTGTPAPSPFPAPAPPPQQRVTSLMEGDAGKLNDPAHIANSPKYQFLSMAPFYGRGQEGDLLHQLQTQYGDYWNGWNFDGRGNFRYGGDPSKLNSAWNGVTSVDAYGGYGDGGSLRARWGVDEPNAASPDLSSALSSFGGMFAQPSQSSDMSWLGPLLTGVLQGMQPGQPPPAAAPTQMSAPPMQPSYSQPSPTFGGGYAQPGYGGGGADATSMLSLALPQLLNDPSLANNPLLQQIRSLVMGRH